MIKKATLIKENEKLKRILYIWENIGIGINSTTKEKEMAVKQFLINNPGYESYEVCNTIKLNRGTYFNFINNKVEKTIYQINDEKLLKEIKIVFEETNRIYGIERIQIALRKKGIITSTRKISELMKANNLVKRNIMKKPKKQVIKKRRNYYRNLLKRHFNQDEPNKVWVSDLLEIRTNGVKFYLCVILDLFARKVIAWRLSHKRNTNLALLTFKDAFETRNEPIGLLFHSDQGDEFKSHVFMNTLKMLGVKQSFSYPGSPNDNAAMEGFYSLLRREEINNNIDHYENSLKIKEYLSNYFELYNNVRIHTSIGNMSPNEKEEEWYNNHQK